MSVLRNYAQRNNNRTQILPSFVGEVSSDVLASISGAAVYRLDIPNVQNTGGIYYVDLNGVDTSGNLLNFSGQIVPLQPGTSINTIHFVIQPIVSASSYPGVEFTIFFKNIPQNIFSGIPFVSIGIVSSETFLPIPYILSPPFPPFLSGDMNSPGDQSITFKSDGFRFSVVSSGPAGWLGLPALLSILTFYAVYSSGP